MSISKLDIKTISQKLMLFACGCYTNTHAGQLVTLDAAKDNIAAMGLYKKLGFTVSDLPSANGDTDVVMTVPLDQLCLLENHNYDTKTDQ